MKRILPLAVLLSLAVSLHVASAEQLRVNISVGSDGYAVSTLVLPPGEYSVTVQGWGQPSGAPRPRPLVLALVPEPGLWERLGGLALGQPALPREPVVRLDETPWGTVVVVVAPGEPGSEITLVVDSLGSWVASGRQQAVDMAIVVPDKEFLAAAEELAWLHMERQGLRVQVFTISQVYKRFRGATLPGDMCPEDRLPRGYNASLASALRAFAASLAAEGARYLLLVGGASQVPPVYYCSPLLTELVGPDEGVVPSDYPYSDPDGDGVVELAVGRLPFTSPGELEAYVETMRRWMDGGSWQRGGLVAGGAPFAYVFLTGEAAAAKASRLLAGLGVEVEALLLTGGGYAGFRLTPYLGRYGLYYVVAHGSGSALLDYVPGGLWNYEFEEKLHSSEIRYAVNPGVWMLPACRNGYWDTDLVKPPFEPPSMAQALLSSGAAVAYIGFSRIAIEVIDAVSLSSGRLDLGLAGADRLLLEYLRSLQGSRTLGEAWAKALTSYASLPAAMYRAYLLRGEERIGSLVLYEATFLGDPAAPNPWGSAEAAPAAPQLRIPGSVSVGASIVAEVLARYSGGALPAARPAADGSLVLSLTGGCPSLARSWGVRRVQGAFLIDLVEDEVTNIEPGNGTCSITVKVGDASPGLHVLTAMYSDGAVEHFYYIVAGAVYDNGKGVVKLYGLDILAVEGDEPALAMLGNKTLSFIPGGSTGYIVPVEGSGVFAVRTLYRYAEILGGPLVAEEYRKLEELFTVTIRATGRSQWLPPLSAASLAPALGLAGVLAATLATRRPPSSYNR